MTYVVVQRIFKITRVVALIASKILDFQMNPLDVPLELRTHHNLDVAMRASCVAVKFTCETKSITETTAILTQPFQTFGVS